MKRRFYVTVYGVTAVRGTDNRKMMTFFEAWSMRGFILSKDPKADVRIMRGVKS
jgi:hypothetical protein